nr:NADH-ubiquinone oxidoreductase chain 6 [Plaxiscelis limbata]
MLMMLLMMISFMFMWLKHPITMGITIIIQTIMVAMITGLMLGSFWYSYIILIMMLSGMLVLFIYMTSVASNEKFFSSIKLSFFMITMIMLAITMQMMDNNSDNEMYMNMYNTPMESMMMNSLFNSKTKYITMLMVMYLFFTMITVSMIVNLQEGPLRIYKK